jgi:hypothetical protein
VARRHLVTGTHRTILGTARAWQLSAVLAAVGRGVKRLSDEPETRSEGTGGSPSSGLRGFEARCARTSTNVTSPCIGRTDARGTRHESALARLETS